jgi:hypothetical protein
VAIVDAQSPYAAYNGRQAYIVTAQMSGNQVSSAIIGLIAGGKDFAILDPQGYNLHLSSRRSVRV